MWEPMQLVRQVRPCHHGTSSLLGRDNSDESDSGWAYHDCLPKEGPECHEGADQVVTRGRASGQGAPWQGAEEGTDLGGTNRKTRVAKTK